MTVWEALAAFQEADGLAELWRLPALRVFRYGRKSSLGDVAEDAAVFLSGGGAAGTAGSAGMMTAVRGLALAGGTPRSRNARLRGVSGGGSAVASARTIRQAVDAGERRLGEAVQLMRERGGSGEADTGAIFSELERRLLAEIGAG
ncbi:MAG: hypothetical protein ACOX64_02725 [Candidatus Merdivicinus sp.]|jgi:hypothetical protein